MDRRDRWLFSPCMVLPPTRPMVWRTVNEHGVETVALDGHEEGPQFVGGPDPHW